MRPAALIPVIAGLLTGCGEEPPSSTSTASPASQVLDGRTLAANNCARCHTLPSPAQMPPEEWPYLLAWMGCHLGIKPDTEINPLLMAGQSTPSQPLVSPEEFAAIRHYFIEQSAAHYQPPASRPEPPVSAHFEPEPVNISTAYVSMAQIDPVDQSLVIGTSHPAGLYVFQNGIATPLEVASEPVTMERIGQRRRIALMGHLGYDAHLGSVVDFNVRDGSRRILIADHPRIAAHCTADLDGDGKPDLVVCGFGDYPKGRVGIIWDGGGEEQVLLDEPGATWCDVADLDGDGRPDIILAIGSNKPRLVAFINQGNRHFEEHTIVERPVGWGYNRCLLVDWDGDGKKDIVELAGNNLELRGRPLKPWHGVRVLHNDGNWRFHEVLFEPLPGAMDVAAGDFEGNGRVDLAVTAFCPDWRDPFPVTFVLLMQQADGTVVREGLNHRYWNRWMRVSAGAAGPDGRTDLILGAAQAKSGVPEEYLDHYHDLIKNKPCVLLLRNVKTTAIVSRQ